MVTSTITIKVAWWLRYYLMGLVLMHKLTGMQPNWGRVNHWVGKASKLQALPVDGGG